MTTTSTMKQQNISCNQNTFANYSQMTINKNILGLFGVNSLVQTDHYRIAASEFRFKSGLEGFEREYQLRF